jgi:hypothetical protein
VKGNRTFTVSPVFFFAPPRIIGYVSIVDHSGLFFHDLNAVSRYNGHHAIHFSFMSYRY